jgi:hypothetical protein
MLPTIPADKANHIIYGAAIGLLAQATCLFLKHPEASPLASLLTATIIGAITEAGDAWDNHLQRKAGFPARHGVETWDVVATSFGGLLVGIAAFMQG